MIKVQATCRTKGDLSTEECENNSAAVKSSFSNSKRPELRKGKLFTCEQIEDVTAMLFKSNVVIILDQLPNTEYRDLDLHSVPTNVKWNASD